MMFPGWSDRPSRYGAGELAGLSRQGASAGCFDDAGEPSRRRAPGLRPAVAPQSNAVSLRRHHKEVSMRTLFKIAGIAIATALALALSSCAQDDATPGATEQSSATPKNASKGTSASASEAPGSDEPVLCAPTTSLTPFTGPAALKFGAAEVMDAYCEMADFFYLHAVTDLTAPRESYDVEDLAWVKEWMATSSDKFWDRAVAKELKDLDDGDGDINRITYFNLRGLVWKGRTFLGAGSGLPGQVGGGIGAARTATGVSDGKPYLDMWFAHTTNIVMQRGGKPVAVPVVRNVGLRLVPTGRPIADAHTWLIDGWTVDYQSSDDKPLSQFSKAVHIAGGTK